MILHLLAADPEPAAKAFLTLHLDWSVISGAVGALLFSCNGRGSRMFPDEPDHDIRRVQAGFEHAIPAAGFFAMGEIGPVGGRNFLHGFTASVAVFRGR